MKLWPFLLSGVLLASSAGATDWSRAGRMVLVQTSKRGQKLSVFYSRLPGEKDVLPALKSCVEQRRKKYATVTCLVYDSAPLMNVTDSQKVRICWSAAAKASTTARPEIQPDNPALPLVPACGGKTRLP